METIKFTITDPVGLHARPATVLVTAVNQAKSTVELEYNSKRVDMKSIMSLLGMAIPTQAEVSIYIDGEDEKEVLMKVIETINTTGIAKL